MKIRKHLLIALTAFIALSGCKHDNQTESPESITQTVEWFKEHKDEREKTLADCKNKVGTIGLTPNCVNAERAQSSITWSATGHTKIEPLQFKK